MHYKARALCNLAWGRFLRIGFFGGAALWFLLLAREVRKKCLYFFRTAFFMCRTLRWALGKKQWAALAVGAQKPARAVARGTKQKTGGFEERKNWVLFCGAIYFCSDFGGYQKF